MLFSFAWVRSIIVDQIVDNFADAVERLRFPAARLSHAGLDELDGEALL
jgi:hypothetical protein